MVYLSGILVVKYAKLTLGLKHWKPKACQSPFLKWDRRWALGLSVSLCFIAPNNFEMFGLFEILSNHC